MGPEAQRGRARAARQALSAQAVKQKLAEFGLTPNRALGQNFLADDGAARRIADAASIAGLPALEIGPGLGALTLPLMERASRVTAVEIDGAMAKALSRAHGGDGKLEIVHADFLKFDLEGYARGAGKYCAAGNLPYYATTPIAMKLLSCPILPERMALMVQKEAAARFTAGVGTKQYGPLAALTRLYYDCAALMALSPASYYPPPEVESVVLAFSRRAEAEAAPALPKLLEVAFSMRRKTLVNNLRAAGFGKEEARALLASLDIPENARAEQVEPGLFAALAKAFRHE